MVVVTESNVLPSSFTNGNINCLFQESDEIIPKDQRVKAKHQTIHNCDLFEPYDVKDDGSAARNNVFNNEREIREEVFAEDCLEMLKKIEERERNSSSIEETIEGCSEEQQDIHDRVSASRASAPLRLETTSNVSQLQSFVHSAGMAVENKLSSLIQSLVNGFDTQVSNLVQYIVS